MRNIAKVDSDVITAQKVAGSSEHIGIVRRIGKVVFRKAAALSGFRNDQTRDLRGSHRRLTRREPVEPSRYSGFTSRSRDMSGEEQVLHCIYL